MARHLTLSRAAQLVGIKRSELQKRIQEGELSTFEGSIELGELLRVFPDAQLTDDSAIRRVELIMESAWNKVKSDQRSIPDGDAFIQRIKALDKSLTHAELRIQQYEDALSQLGEKIQQLGKSPEDTPESLTLFFAAVWEEMQGEIHIPADLLGDTLYRRLMAARVQILPSMHTYYVEGMDTLLESALQAGYALNYGCSNGNCGKCKARLINGQIKKTHNHDYVITEAEKLQGVFLSCSNTALTDVVIEAQEAYSAHEIPQQRIATRIKRIEFPTADMAVLSLQTPRSKRLRFLAGQQASLSIGNQTSATYYIASCPCDDRNIQFHISRNADDSFTHLVFNKAKSGDAVTIVGPSGDFTWDDDSKRPSFFIAVDNGFAPIKSLIEHALALEQVDEFHLLRLTNSDITPYLNNQCRAWADALDNFTYSNVPLQPIYYASAIKAVISEHAAVDYDAFVAAPGNTLEEIKSVLLELGLNSNAIHCGITH